MNIEDMNRPVVEYWMKHYIVNGLCSLCGNSGIIHTEGIRTPAGTEVGRANFCICPNGQEQRYFSEQCNGLETHS
jgi:hypothetical protein